MSSEWPWVSLADAPLEIMDGDRGTNYPSQNDFLSLGHCLFLNTGNVTTEGFNFSSCAYISAEKDSALRKGKLKRGDVVLTTRGTVGNVAYYQDDVPFEHVRINSGMVILRSEQSQLSSHFLYLFVRSNLFIQQVKSLQSGSAQPQLPIRDMKRIEMPIPSLSEQAAICVAIGSIDDRITLLRETNQTLEAIAQALFKSWFVEFDPVRAKAEGRLPDGIDAATAELFPDAFEETELGMVPRGWEVKKFGDFIDRQSVGKKFDQKTALAEGAVPILDQGKSGIIGFHNESAGVKASLENPVVVFANHTCYMRLICFDFSAIQNVLPFTGKQVDTIWAYYATRDRIKFSEYKGHWPDFAIEKAVVPPEVLTKLYKDAVSPLVHRIRLNELQANTLSNLRDTLLPRLISGQLRIADAEVELEKAIA